MPSLSELPGYAAACHSSARHCLGMDEMNWWNQAQHNSGVAGPADATQPVPPPTGAKNRRRKATRWAAGLAAAALLAGGGVVAGLDLSHRGPSQSGEAAVLSSALSDAGNTPSSTATSGQADQGLGVHARRVARIVRRLRGIHGEFTVRQRGGGFRQIAFERGVIVAANDKDVTVRAADGILWTWTLTSKTVVVKNRAKASPSSLATGDRLFVGGPESGSVRDARLIIVARNPGARQSGTSRSGSTSSLSG